MKKWIQWFIFSVALVFSAALLMIGLLAGSITLLLQALIYQLTPSVGVAAAYAITGGVCLAAVVLIGSSVIMYLRRVRRVSVATGDAEGGGDIDTHPVWVLVQQHPLESVLAAFAVGLTASEPEEFKRITADLLRQY